MKIVYMSIADYTIQLNFHATEYIQTQAIFSDVFSKLYKGYLIRKWTKPVHMTIDFVHSGFTETKKEQNETHTRFYTVLGPKRIQTYYSISISQFALLLHYVLFDLLTDGFYLHASSSLYKGKVFIFLGPSGSGKSTAIQLLKKYATPFSDDSLIVRKVHNRYLCFQPPFIDKISIQKKKNGYPIGGIYFIAQSSVSSIRKVPTQSIVHMLMESLFTNTKTKAKFSASLFECASQLPHCFHVASSLRSARKVYMKALGMSD